jgi:predicted ATPase
VARALGTPLTGGNGVERVADVLAERGSLLLILDNCEGVVALAHATIGRWMRKAPQARFVVTSRERLREPGEVVLDLKPLHQPAAVALFMDRARSANRAFTADACLLNDIVDRLECLPLAIELAAARSNILSAQGLLDRLSHPLQVLGRGPRGAPGRGESLRGALDASWEILIPWERAVLAQCSVFRGGFTVDAVEAVLDVSHLEGAPWVVDIVQALQDKSLIASYSPDDMPGELRLRLYESVRDYAAEHLDDEAVAARYRAFYLSLGERLVGALDGPEASSALQRLELERDNLLWIHRSAAEGSASDRVRAVTVLDPLLSAHGPLDVQLSLLDDAVSICEGVSPRLRGQVYRLRGEARRVRGQIEGAREDLELALTIGESLGESPLESRTLSSLSFLYWSSGGIDEALSLAHRALELHRARSDRAYESLMRMTIGVLKKKAGDPMEAEAHYRQALAIQREHGVIRYQGLTLLNLANLMRSRGQLDEAERLYAQSSEAFGRFGHLRWQATALHNQAALCAQRGDLDMAKGIAEEALVVARQGGETLTVVHVLHCLGHVLHLQGRLDEAERAYTGAISRLADVDPVLHASSRGDLGALQADQDRTEQSERTLKSVEAVLATAAPEMMQVLALHWGHLHAARARAASRSGYADEAERHLAEARRRLVEVEEAVSESHSRPRMAIHLLHLVLERP